VTGPVADRGLHHTFAVIDLASLDEKDLPAEYPSAVTLAELSTGLRRSSGGAQRSSRRNTISKSAATMETPRKGRRRRWSGGKPPLDGGSVELSAAAKSRSGFAAVSAALRPFVAKVHRPVVVCFRRSHASPR
jgi:hypothetical protein